MKNKQITDSWNKVEPDEAAQERMLGTILVRTHSGEPQTRKAITMNGILNWKRFAPIAACLVLAVAIATPLLNNNHSDFDLKLSDNSIKVTYTNNPPSVDQGDMLVSLTEKELFAKEHHGYEIVAFSGTIKEIRNIEIDFNGRKVYWAIARIAVDDVLRGNVEAGSTVTVRIPAPIDLTLGSTSVQTSGMSTASQMEAGMKGVFMPIKYDETSTYKTDDKTLYLLEVAEYGFLDGERWMFLETPEGLDYSNAYHPPFPVTNLDEAKQYVKERAGK